MTQAADFHSSCCGGSTRRGVPLHVFTSDSTLDAEITHRVAAADSACQQPRQANIWSSRVLTMSVRVNSYTLSCQFCCTLEEHVPAVVIPNEYVES